MKGISAKLKQSANHGERILKMEQAVKVFLEDQNGVASEHIATFANDEIYGECVQSLDKWANEGGSIITESLVENQSFLGFAILPMGKIYHEVLEDLESARNFLQGFNEYQEKPIPNTLTEDMEQGETRQVTLPDGGYLAITKTRHI